MAGFDHNDPAKAIRGMAGHTDRIREEMVRLAVSYNIHIVAGSMPEYQDQILRNVSYLRRRDGTWDRQSTLHLTPDEVAYWGVQGGDALSVLATDVCRTGILVCSDIAFPHPSRVPPSARPTVGKEGGR